MGVMTSKTKSIDYDRNALDNLKAQVNAKSDDEIREMIHTRFNYAERLVSAIRARNIRALILSGPPGIGKSFGVEKVLFNGESLDKLMLQAMNDTKRTRKYDIIKGHITPVMLFTRLYEYSDPGSVVVLDDCDAVLQDEDSLNLLKAAMDSSPVRRISWASDSRVLRGQGVPNDFNFNAGVVVITNINFDYIKSGTKVKMHLDAIKSRAHYMDLGMVTTREKMIRIRDVVGQGMLIDQYDCEPEEAVEIMDFVEKYKDRLDELSLRMVGKIANLYKCMGEEWQEFARQSCMRNQPVLTKV